MRGEIGIAGGWYNLSPNWSSLFTGNAAPAAYGAAHTIKALVLMTDGEYNSIYCNGVIAQNSTSGSGDTNYHINCNSQNGKDPYAPTHKVGDTLEDVERELLYAALRYYGGNKRRAARRLGISLKTVYNRLARY